MGELCWDGKGSGRPLLRLLPNCPQLIVLDIDDNFDAVHGGQQLRLLTPITTNTAFTL